MKNSDKDNFIKALMNGLRENKTLINLDISNNELFDNDEHYFENYIKEIFNNKLFNETMNKTLTTFNIEGNNFTDHTIIEINAYLTQNKNLLKNQ